MANVKTECMTVSELRRRLHDLPGDAKVKILNHGGIISRLADVWMDEDAIISISRKRMCMKAAPETRAAWEMFLDELVRVEPDLASCCVPECVYRGFCPEFKPCGFCGSSTFRQMLDNYRSC